MRAHRKRSDELDEVKKAFMDSKAEMESIKKTPLCFLPRMEAMRKLSEFLNLNFYFLVLLLPFSFSLFKTW